MNNILLGIFFLILGLLFMNMLTNVCGCRDLIEGQYYCGLETYESSPQAVTCISNQSSEGDCTGLSPTYCSDCINQNSQQSTDSHRCATCCTPGPCSSRQSFLVNACLDNCSACINNNINSELEGCTFQNYGPADKYIVQTCDQANSGENHLQTGTTYKLVCEDDDTIKGLLSSDNTKHQFPDGTTYKLSCNSGKLEANIND